MQMVLPVTGMFSWNFGKRGLFFYTYVSNVILHVTFFFFILLTKISGFKNMKPEFAIIKSLVFALSLTLVACGESSTDSTTSNVTAQCADGIDNDSDSLIDLNDSGCANTADNDESDDPLSSTQCADGIDNDSDSLIDLNDPGCANAADNDESDDPVSLGHDAARANSYDDAWESAWVANAKTILSPPVGITKEPGKVLQVGDSMTFTFAYGDWARKKDAATATVSDLDVMNWMHAGAFDLTDGWYLSSANPTTGDPAVDNTTAMNNAGWGSAFVDNIFVDPDLNDAQFAVVMFNVQNITVVENRINEFINAGIVPVLSTIPPRISLNDFNTNFADPYNLELHALAERISLPIIDFSKEILLRRPNGTWENTLISSDGVHPSGKVDVTLPSGTVITYVPSSDPYADGGDVLTHTTGEAALYSGQLLRTWLTVQKMKEIKQKVVD